MPTRWANQLYPDLFVVKESLQEDMVDLQGSINVAEASDSRALVTFFNGNISWMLVRTHVQRCAYNALVGSCDVYHTYTYFWLDLLVVFFNWLDCLLAWYFW